MYSDPRFGPDYVPEDNGMNMQGNVGEVNCRRGRGFRQ